VTDIDFRLLSAVAGHRGRDRRGGAVLGADPGRDIFLRLRASEAQVKKTRLAPYRVVMFATHGLMGGDLPGLHQPALALSNPALSGDGEDGLLTMEEILNLKLNADWVVLSACNTAAAGSAAQEAVSGLGRAFFYAGAKSLLVTGWAVETESARMLTTEAFRRQASDPGLSRAMALRLSSLALMGKTAAGVSVMPTRCSGRLTCWSATAASLSGAGQGQALRTNSDLSDIAPMPSILQSMSWSPSTSRMFLTLVPTLTTSGRALDLEVLDHGDAVTILQLVAIGVAYHAHFFGALLATVVDHSWAHSGQT
jgi:hypothetical protein